MDKPIQPYYLPQVNAPFKYVIDNLEEMGIQHKPIIIKASLLKPIQKGVDMNKIIDIASKITDNPHEDQMSPIYVSNKNNIVDGHHRAGAYIYKFGENAKLKAIKIDADDKDSPTILKVIQDRFEREYKKPGELFETKEKETPEQLAVWMHENYEEIAKAEGWNTQEATKVPFEQLPAENKKVMLEISKRLLDKFQK